MSLRANAWPLIFTLLMLIGLYVVYLLFSTPEADESWTAFVVSHHCESTGAQSGSDRGGWRCDDGKTYYRWRQQK